MQQQNLDYYCLSDESDEVLTIDLKKIALAIWSRKELIIKVFASVLVFFILLTFTSAKRYTVKADLYINKSNNSNLMEVNPFVLEEASSSLLATTDKAMMNELELMKSSLVISKVIQENDLRFKKLYGIIPTKKCGQYLTPDAFLKKNISFENKKNTSVITIEFKSKNPQLAYNVVNSIINNYIVLHKEINTEKSKSDKDLIEKEYNQAKANLNKKMQTVNGLPATVLAGAGNLSAMSAYSKSALNAIETLKGQYVEGEKSQIEVKENAETVSQLASKLEWARLVDEMSDSSKVIVLKEPQHLRDFEYSSPRLLTNIILGIVFGIIASLAAVIFKEVTDKRLAYSMLGDDIIYNIEKDYIDLKSILLANKNEPVSFVIFEGIDDTIIKQLQQFKNINFVKADITEEFENGIENSEKIVIIAKIGKTDARLYKRIRQFLTRMNKNILVEVLE